MGGYLLLLTYGGGSLDQKSSVCLVTPENGNSGIRLNFNPWASSEDGPKENFCLNGFNILTIKGSFRKTVLPKNSSQKVKIHENGA